MFARMQFLYDTTAAAWQQFQYACVVVCIALMLESLLPAQRSQPLRHVAFNIAYAWFFFFFANLLSPLLDPVTKPIIQALRLGIPIAFPDGLFGQLLQVLAFYFVFDFFYYWLHRSQHAIPWLWAQHKLHHSDESLNATTANRHHWLEVPLHGLVIWLPLGILFQQKAVTIGWLWTLFLLWGYFIHMNVRLSMGPLTPVFAGPQLHRIHHSLEPQHRDKNFAAAYPVFDILFGTYCPPKSGEFPTTGLSDGEDLNGLARANFAPFVTWWRAAKSRVVKSRASRLDTQ